MVGFTLIHVKVNQSELSRGMAAPNERGLWQVVLVMCTASVLFASPPQLDAEG